MIVVMPVMVVDHFVATAEPLAEVPALIAWQIGMTELIVAVRIGWTTSIDIVACCFIAIVETAVPCMRPAAFRLVRLPGSWRRAFLCVNGEGGSAG